MFTVGLAVATFINATVARIARGLFRIIEDLRMDGCQEFLSLTFGLVCDVIPSQAPQVVRQPQHALH